MDYAAAVHRRQVIRFRYDGLERVVQPATVGVSTAGNLVLRACQVGGRSHTGTVPCWRLFKVADIVRPALTGEVFTEFAVDGYTRGDAAFSDIAAEH